MKTRYILVKQTASKGTQYLVQLPIRGKCVYLGRYSTHVEAATLADASYYHAVLAGVFPRKSVSTLTATDFNDWATARQYVEGGVEKAPAAHPKLAAALAELPKVVLGAAEVVGDFRTKYPELAVALDALESRIAALERKFLAPLPAPTPFRTFVGEPLPTCRAVPVLPPVAPPPIPKFTPTTSVPDVFVPQS